jgi:hypothetical protein
MTGFEAIDPLVSLVLEFCSGGKGHLLCRAGWFEKVVHLTRKRNKFGIIGSGARRYDVMGRATIKAAVDTFIKRRPILCFDAKNIRGTSLVDERR